MTWTQRHGNGVQYLDQLLTLAYCGVFGVVALMIQQRGLLRSVLPEQLHYWLMWGAIALLNLVLLRVWMLWLIACGATGEDGKDDSILDWNLSRIVNLRGQNPGWIPIRYVVLMVPIFLYFLGLPNEGFGIPRDRSGTEGEIREMTLRELDRAASDSEQRAALQGKTIRIKGLFVGFAGNNRVFCVIRFKFGDMDPFITRVLVDDSKAIVAGVRPEDRSLDPIALHHKWVEVTGHLRFDEDKQKPGKWNQVLVVVPTPEKPLSQLIKQVLPDQDPDL